MLLQLKDPLILFIKWREFLLGSGFLFCCDMTQAVESDIKTLSQPYINIPFLRYNFFPWHTHPFVCIWLSQYFSKSGRNFVMLNRLTSSAAGVGRFFSKAVIRAMKASMFLMDSVQLTLTFSLGCSEITLFS